MGHELVVICRICRDEVGGRYVVPESLIALCPQTAGDEDHFYSRIQTASYILKVAAQIPDPRVNVAMQCQSICIDDANILSTSYLVLPSSPTSFT